MARSLATSINPAKWPDEGPLAGKDMNTLGRGIGPYNPASHGVDLPRILTDR